MRASLICLLLPALAGLAQASTEVSGEVGGQTWSAGTYHATDDLTIGDNTTLSLEPGVVLKCAPGVRLTVLGTLLAPGTADTPIVFTSIHDDSVGEGISGSDGTPAPGDWDGIDFYGAAHYEGAGDLDFCQIHYGGGPGANQNAGLHANSSNYIYLDNCSIAFSAGPGLFSTGCSPWLVDNVFEQNAGNGAHCNGGAPTFRDNACLFNGSWGARLEGVTLGSYTGNTGSGNALNGLAVNGSTSANQTWATPASSLFPIVLADEVAVSDNTTLTVDSLSVLKGMSEGLLRVYGTLYLNGLAGYPVTLTSIHDDSVGGDTGNDGGSASPGDWPGIWCYGHSFYEGALSMSWSTLSYAGGDSTYAQGLTLDRCDWATIHDSEIRHHAGHGVYSYACSPGLTANLVRDNALDGYRANTGTPSLTDNVFNDNGAHGVFLDAITVTSYSGNEGTGNGVNAFALNGTLTSNRTLSHPDQGFPYLLTGELTVSDNTSLTLPAGSLVKGMPDARILSYGSTFCNGTLAEPVVLTSSSDDSHGGDTLGDGPIPPAPGDWRGVYGYGHSFYEGVISMHHTLLRYGGLEEEGGLRLYRSDWATIDSSRIEYSLDTGLQVFECSPTLSNSILADNGDHGLHCTGSSAPWITHNGFLDNGAYGVRLEGVTVTSYSGNTGSGNAVNGFGLDGTVTTNRNWSHPEHSFPFLLTGELVISDNTTLSLPAGTLVKAEAGGRFMTYGSLQSVATPAEPTVLTSWKDDSVGGDTYGDGALQPMPGDWRGIYGYGNSFYEGVVHLEHNRVYYGGDADSSSANIRLSQSNWATIDSCEVGYSSGPGLLASECSPSLSSSLWHDNLSEGVSCTGASPWLSNNHFEDNGSWGARLEGVTLTSYSGNTGSGNAFNGFALNGSVSSDRSWEQGGPGFPFVMTGGITINDNVSLSLNGRQTLKAQPGTQLLAYGTLIANGSGTQPITFCSFAADDVDGDTNGDGPSAGSPGDWIGLYFYGYSHYEGVGNLSGLRLRHAGDGQAALRCYQSNWMALNNCEVSRSAGVGIDHAGFSLSLRGTHISHNAGDGLLHTGSGLDMGACPTGDGGNCIHDNGGFALNNSSTQNVSACGNFWGATTASAIDARIRDDEEDGTLGVVSFDPWNTESCRPVITSITVADGLVELEWTTVPGVLYYNVYSSAAPWAGFAIDESGSFVGESWAAPAPAFNSYYYVEAVTE